MGIIIILNTKVIVIIKNKNLSLDKYLKKIEPYFRNIIIDIQIPIHGKFSSQLKLTLFFQKMLKKSVKCTQRAII